MCARSKLTLALLFVLTAALQGCMSMQALTNGENAFFHAENEGIITSPCVVYMLGGKSVRFAGGETKIVSVAGTAMITGHPESTNGDTLQRIPLREIRAIAPLHQITIYTSDSSSIESGPTSWYLLVSHGTIDTLYAEGTRLDSVTGEKRRGAFTIPFVNIRRTETWKVSDEQTAMVKVMVLIAVVGLVVYGIAAGLHSFGSRIGSGMGSSSIYD